MISRPCTAICDLHVSQMSMCLFTSQENTFVIQLAFKGPCSALQPWSEHFIIDFSAFLFFKSPNYIKVAGKHTAKALPCLFTGFFLRLSPSSPCILCTCCWRRPMKGVSLSDKHPQMPSVYFFKNTFVLNPQFFVSLGALVYEQLGYKAFGTPGKFAASLSITMQNIGGKKNECYVTVIDPTCAHSES